MKVWNVINVTADDRTLEAILNYDMERKGRVVKEIILIEDNGQYKQYKIIYTEDEAEE